MDPSHVRYSADLSNTYNTLGNLHADRREWEQARDAYRASRRLRQELAERHPDIPEYRLGLAGNACNLGNVERDAGRPAEAVPWYRAADELLEPLRVRFPNAPAVRNFSRNTYVGLGMALSRLCRHEESLANWQKALALAPQFEKERDRLRVEWAVCLAAAGQLEAAQHEIESLKQRYTRDGSMLVHLARVAARASAVQGLPQDLADRWAERAVEFLLAAAELRHFDDQDHRAELARNPDLAPLKARPEFMKLVESPDGG
jgi:tetratricopeptide (TPR) repeat protein